MKDWLPILLILLFLSPALAGQVEADSSVTTPFRKGRNLVRLEGSIASSYIDQANNYSARNQTGNNYSYAFSLGKLVADKHVLALEFKVSRNNLVGLINSTAETMLAGPFYRYYIGWDPSIAFYLQSGLAYANYFGSSNGNPPGLQVKESLEVQGVRAALGFGLSYVLLDRACFEVGCEYSQGRYWGMYEDQITGNTADVVLNRGNLVFNFGFAILFEKLKKDE